MELSLERVADAVMALRVDLRDRPDLEKRQLPRFPVWAPRTIHPRGDAGRAPAAPFEVWLIDIACGGIGFLCKQPLETGGEFYVSIPGADGPEMHVLARVVHCRRMVNGSYTSGAQFVKEVSELPGSVQAPQAAAR